MAFEQTTGPYRNDGVYRARSQYGQVNNKDSGNIPEKPDKFDPVVKGKVRLKKNDGLFAKLKDVFIANDAETVRSYVFNKIFVPGAIDIFMDMVWGGMNMFFYPESAADIRRPRKRDFGTSKYADSGKSSVIRERSTDAALNSRRIDQLEFEDRGEAEEVLDKCYIILEDYKILSIADVLDTCNKEHTHADCYWGWEDLGNTRVRREGRYYTITFPRAKRLD